MADPLSFTASVIAVTTLTVHISRLARNIFHASDEVIALQDEVEDARAPAKLLQSLCRKPWPPDQQTNIVEAKRILDDVLTKRLQKIQGYLDKLEPYKTKATQTIRYVALRRKTNTKREGLRGAKQHLFDIVCILNASTTGSLSLQTTHVIRDVEQVQHTQVSNQQEILARLDQYHGPVQNIYMQDYRNVLARFDQYLGPIQGADVQTHREILTRFDQYLDRIQSMRVLIHFGQYFAPNQDGQIQNNQDLVSHLIRVLDCFQKTQNVLQLVHLLLVQHSEISKNDFVLDFAIYRDIDISCLYKFRRWDD